MAADDAMRDATALGLGRRAGQAGDISLQDRLEKRPVRCVKIAGQGNGHVGLVQELQPDVLHAGVGIAVLLVRGLPVRGA